jgi:hypothetical protein
MDFKRDYNLDGRAAVMLKLLRKRRSVMEWLNPMEWLSWVYGKFFQSHPYIGGALFCSIGAFICLAIWVRAVDKYEVEHPDTANLSYVKTGLRLQFLGGQRPATQISAENIYSWYTLWTPSATLEVGDKGQKIHETMVYPENWAIFVVFEKPTKFSEVNIYFSSPGFPQYEVKQNTPRSLVINVSGSIPAGFLEIYLKR